MKNKLLIFIVMSFILTGCIGVSSKGLFGTGVSVALDPRTVGTQIDDSIMQKSLTAKIIARDKKYILSVKSKVIDGRIFLTGKVDEPEEKLYLTKLAWETKGARSHGCYRCYRNAMPTSKLNHPLPIDHSLMSSKWSL